MEPPTDVPPAPGPDAAADAAIARVRPRIERREFATYRCGTTLPAALAHAPETTQEAFRIVVRGRLDGFLRGLRPDARLDPLHPDIIVEARPDEMDVFLVVAPIFVAGRYRKLARGLSQTAFFCRTCRGRGGRRRRGCADCGSTGRVVAEAVEDFVVPHVCAAALGARAAFHGCGREDVDVRMLGSGRPFVVSVESPVLRTPPLDGVPPAVVASSGGRVEVEDLRVVSRDEMGRITSDHGAKRYRVTVAAASDADLPADAPARIASLAGADLDQRTPRRVDARRADLVRRRRVLTVEVEESGPRRLVAVVGTDPGTYVKEFVSGDEGRTVPSVAAAMGVPCACAELDVLDVAGGITSGTS